MSLAGAFRVLISELASVGLDPGAVCVAAQVDPRAPEDDTVTIDLPQLARVLARAEDMSGDALLGLHMAERARGRGILSYLARAQRDVGDGLAAFVRYAGTAWGADAVRMERRGQRVFVGLSLGDGVPRHVVEYVVARTAIALRRSAASAQEAWFVHAPGGEGREYERVLRCPVRFRASASGLILGAADLARPVASANPDAARVLAAALDRPAARESSTAARLAAAVEAAIARGERPDREALARMLGMSGKTLARRLAAERQGFRIIVDEVRKMLAHRLLVEEALAVGHVAQRVGFADPAALGKAFRRWFGKSPSSVRSRPSVSGRPIR